MFSIQNLKEKMHEMSNKMTELQNEKERFQATACEAEEILKQQKKKVEEKLHEICQLTATIEQANKSTIVHSLLQSFNVRIKNL